MSEARNELIRALIVRRVRELRNQIRAAEELSHPVAEGHWRWADMELDGYKRKSPERLAEDRERNRIKAAELREELRTLTGK